MTEALFPTRIMFHFIETLSAEFGRDAVSEILSKSNLPKEWAFSNIFLGMNDAQAAQAYAQIQAALRLYYGRGARGALFRIGSKLWESTLNDAGFARKSQAAVIRNLPKALRRKPALELLAKLLSPAPEGIVIHTHDLDLLVVDRASAATLNQESSAPICYVTLGLLRECLFWADGMEYDLEEISCRASGASQCEFKVTVAK